LFNPAKNFLYFSSVKLALYVLRADGSIIKSLKVKPALLHRLSHAETPTIL
jgi:hypothetical protein